VSLIDTAHIEHALVHCNIYVAVQQKKLPQINHERELGDASCGALLDAAAFRLY